MRKIKENKVLGRIEKQIPVWLLPVIIPRVTRPEDWLIVQFTDGRSGYVETKLLK
jgi:hypothetical protein